MVLFSLVLSTEHLTVTTDMLWASDVQRMDDENAEKCR